MPREAPDRSFGPPEEDHPGASRESGMPLFFFALLSFTVDLPGLARLEVPAGLQEETKLGLARVSSDGLHPRRGERLLSAVKVTGRVHLAGRLPEGLVTFPVTARDRRLGAL